MPFSITIGTRVSARCGLLSLVPGKKNKRRGLLHGIVIASVVSENAKGKLQEVFESQLGASVKHKNKAVCKAALALVSKVDPECPPILLQKLNVEIFVKFLFARARTKGCKYLSKSGCGGYHSALRELFNVSKQSMTTDFHNDLSKKIKGILRGHAEEKNANGGRLSEGKDPMTFRLYKFLCKKMLEDGSKESIFAHAFLTIMWNLICRSKNTIYIHRDHITYGTDCVIIRFAHTKTDAEGSNQAHARHVYCNPHNPVICAVTSLAKYLSTFLPKEDGLLFDSKSYSRFRKYLQRTVNENKTEVERLGVNVKDIGVHSIRKGAATYCCGGTTAAPHIAAVCNRAGWSMGKVKDTYIQYAEAGDQHVGRVVAGLPVLSAKYACSPPYFCVDESESPKEKTCTGNDIEHAMQTLFPTFADTVTFKPVAIRCAAALFFAYDMFMTYMKEDSVFRLSSALFTTNDAILVKVRNATMISHAWDSTPYFDTAELTGIPSYIVTYVNQEKISLKLDVKFNEHATLVRQELDNRQMGGNLTMDQIHRSITEPLTQNMETLAKALEILQQQVAITPQPPRRGIASTDTFFTWNNEGSKVAPHMLPEDFKINTKLTPIAIWQHWHHGIDVDGYTKIPPLKDVPAADCPKKQRRIFRQMILLCRALDRATGLQRSTCVASLKATFNSKLSELREYGVLLPLETPVGRKWTRNENSWHYNAAEYERRLKWQKEADEKGVCFEDIAMAASDKERARQKAIRERRKRQRIVEDSNGASATNTAMAEETNVRVEGSRVDDDFARAFSANVAGSVTRLLT